MNNLRDSFSVIYYYARKKYYHILLEECQKEIAKFQNEPILIFWQAFGLSMIGEHTESIRLLDSIKDIKECSFAVTHKLCTVPDQEAVSKLKINLREIAKTQNVETLLLAAHYFAFTDKIPHSKRCLTKIFEIDNDNIGALCLIGWMELNELEKNNHYQIINLSNPLFTETLSTDDIEILFGRIKYLQLLKRFKESLELVLQLLAKKSWFLPALIEKMLLHYYLQQYDQSLETAYHIFNFDPSNIDAQLYRLIYHLTQKYDFSNNVQLLTDLVNTIKQREPRNISLFYFISRLVSTLSQSNHTLLSLCISMTNHSLSIDHSNGEILSHLGHLYYLDHNIVHSLKLYTQATEICEDENTEILFEENDRKRDIFMLSKKRENKDCIESALGVLRCKLALDQSSDFASKFEFLQNALDDTPNAQILELMALSKSKDSHDHSESLSLFSKCINIHLSSLSSHPFNYEYLLLLNIEYLFSIAQHLAKFLGTEPLHPSDPTSPLLSEIFLILSHITSLVPSHISAQLLLAQCYYLSNNYDELDRTIHHILSLDDECGEVFLLSAQKNLNNQQYHLIPHDLKKAISRKYRLQNTPTYVLLNSRYLLYSGHTQEALNLLTFCLNEIIQNQNQIKKHLDKGESIPTSLSIYSMSEHISILIEMSRAYHKQGNKEKSLKILADCRKVCQNHPDKYRIDIQESIILFDNDEVEVLLLYLSTGSFFSLLTYALAKAMIQKAEIILKYSKNRRGYAQCFQESRKKDKDINYIRITLICNHNPNKHSYVLLAEAYMTIQEPSQAMKAYEKAYELDPSDQTLCHRIGQALTSTHDYNKAIAYYESIHRLGLKNQENYPLILELCELYYQLGEDEKVEKIIQDFISQHTQSPKKDILEVLVKAYTLLAKLHKKQKKIDEVIIDLEQAYNIQGQYISFLSSKMGNLVSHDQLFQKKKDRSVIAHHLAETHLSLNHYKESVSYFKEAINNNDADIESHLALARLYLSNDEYDNCQYTCNTLLEFDTKNEEATLMLADLMFRKEEHNKAINYFQTLLSSQPTHYLALESLIKTMKRNGRIQEVITFLNRAEKFKKDNIDPGFHYCKGLYHRYIYETNEALNHFNKARKDITWGNQTLLNMIEIYLNPEDENMIVDNTELMANIQLNNQHLKYVHRLLEEMEFLYGVTLQSQLLFCYALMASNQREEIEKALEMCKTLSTDKKNVAVIAAMALGYLLLKDEKRARNILKVVDISKYPYRQEIASELERAWLLSVVANIKVTTAKNLCDHILKYNKSCVKAWEYLGYIGDLNHDYEYSCSAYESAWIHSCQKMPSIGYKLAFSYLKAKRFIDCIDVCHKVLEKNPDYQKIRDVLNLAYNNIRP